MNNIDKYNWEHPPCYLEEKDNPYPLCVGRSFANCAHYCLWTDYDLDEDESRVNRPLTLDELRRLDGAVWDIQAHLPQRLAFGRYGKTWLAYRRKKEEGENATA